MVNNAGYGMWGPAREADLAEWHKMVDVNLNGVLATTHAALPHLTAAAQGPRGIADIITVSSVGGRKVLPGNNVYAATKHAVGAFSESLRQELAEHHVRVGLVEPGVVVTEMTTNARNNARTRGPPPRSVSSRQATSPTLSSTCSPAHGTPPSAKCSSGRPSRPSERRFHCGREPPVLGARLCAPHLCVAALLTK